jgi:hypothetical protein
MEKPLKSSECLQSSNHQVNLRYSGLMFMRPIDPAVFDPLLDRLN